MSGSVALTGPVETPGAPKLTPVTLSEAINEALATNYAATTAEAARAQAAEAALAAAQPWKLATVTALGFGLGLYEGTLSVTFAGSPWQVGNVATLGDGLALADGVLSVIGGGGGGGGDWGAGVVSMLGPGLALLDGDLDVDTNVIAAWADISVAIGGISTDAQTAKTLATAVQTATTPPAFQAGVIIPYYQYVSNPYDDADFSNLLTLIRSYPTVPVIVVVNQTGDGAGGPGPYDAAMAQQIRMLQASGAAVAGYVSTINGTRDQSLVLADIAAWRSLYPLTPLDAVFFDQMPYDVGEFNANIQLYLQYYATARQAGYKLVIANPGSLQLSDWYSNVCADIYCCYEGNHWPAPADLSITPPSYFSGAITDYPVRHYAGLVYASAWDASAYSALRPWLRWIYATDSPSPASDDNPWGALSSYLADLFAAAQGDVIATTLRTGGTAGPTWTSGTGAPGATEPNGSLYSRSDGTTGSRLYVSQGGGTWAAVASV